MRVSFNKVAGLRPAALLKKGLRQRCFPVNFAKFLLASTFSIEPLRVTASETIEFHMQKKKQQT